MSSRPPISRTTAIVTSAVLGVIAAGLLVVFIVHLSHAKGGKVQIGETEFRIPIKVTRLVNDAAKAPLFFPDARGRYFDVYVSHLGTDPLQGWQAFEAHEPGVARVCDVHWQAQLRMFKAPCGGKTYPEDGTGLVHYPVRVDTSQHLIVNFQSNIGTSPQTASSTP